MSSPSDPSGGAAGPVVVTPALLRGWPLPAVGSSKYGRGQVLVVVNFGADPIELPAGEVVVSSVPLEDRLLPRDAAVWLRR